MLVEFNRGDNILFTTDKTKVLKYNSVILDKIYIKGKGYFYEILYQEIIKKPGVIYSQNDLINNNNFKREWILYKNVDDILITVPFINRGNLPWKYFGINIKRIPYLYKDVISIEKKYNINIIS